MIPMLTRTQPSTLETDSTRRLLTCGAVAGPLFIGVAFIQILARDGFDLGRHPLSLLSLGDLGWIQVLNFVVGGLLSIAFAVGLRRSAEQGWAGRWGPRLYGGFGLGMVAGGLFLTDPSEGFPPGYLKGSASWHGVVHDVAAGIAVDLALISCLLIARRFRAADLEGWSRYSVFTGITGLALSWWPDHDGISVRLALVVALILTWATAVALLLRRGEKTPLVTPSENHTILAKEPPHTGDTGRETAGP